MLAVQFLHAGTGHVSVYLSRRQVAVPQQHLHHTQISTVIQEVGSKRMPQRVRRHFDLDIGRLRVTLNNVPERLPGHAITAAGRKQKIGLQFQQNL